MQLRKYTYGYTLDFIISDIPDTGQSTDDNSLYLNFELTGMSFKCVNIWATTIIYIYLYARSQKNGTIMLCFHQTQNDFQQNQVFLNREFNIWTVWMIFSHRTSHFDIIIRMSGCRTCISVSNSLIQLCMNSWCTENKCIYFSEEFHERFVSIQLLYDLLIIPRLYSDQRGRAFRLLNCCIFIKAIAHKHVKPLPSLYIPLPRQDPVFQWLSLIHACYIIFVTVLLWMSKFPRLNIFQKFHTTSLYLFLVLVKQLNWNLPNKLSGIHCAFPFTHFWNS